MDQPQPAPLTKKIRFRIPLTLITGLHIGGNSTDMSIGGVDNTVIRDPMTQQPYIPGSSLKGKMRSLTAKLLGAYQKRKMGADINYPAFEKLEFKDEGEKFKRIIPELYGTASGGEKNIPSRIIVRDAHLTDSSIEKLEKSDYTDMPYTEVKKENTIDRVTAAAIPRDLERVPAGAVFMVDMILNVFEGDKEEKLVDYVKVGLRLIEDDYLGGNGSRGSGYVEFIWDHERATITQKTLADYENGLDWQPANGHNIGEEDK